VLIKNALALFRAKNTTLAASSLDQAGGENAPPSGAMFRFRIAKQQPQTSGET
jgi:hypothetical protein